MKYILLLILSVITASCTPHKSFMNITIASQGSNGSAVKEISSAGEIFGSHVSYMSGSSNSPFVHQDNGKISSDSLSLVKKLIAQIPTVGDTIEEPQSGCSITIEYSDNSRISFYSKCDENFSSKELQKLWDFVCSIDVGGW